jgi:hypothetical protein
MDLTTRPKKPSAPACSAFLAEKLPGLRTRSSGKRLSRDEMERMARHPQRARLAGQPLARRMAARLERGREVHLRHECAWRRAAHRAVRREHAGPGADQVRQRSAEAYWLPRILSGEDWWCQGYSEPGAGSDLASVKTTAVRDGDHIVNGQKTWTTLGQHANMIFCLVRTNREAKKQEGISFLLIDMNSPGVEVRPIITLDGEHEVNEVFFTDVRCRWKTWWARKTGWTYAKYLLTYERTNIAGVGFSVAALQAQGIAARCNATAAAG